MSNARWLMISTTNGLVGKVNEPGCSWVILDPVDIKFYDKILINRIEDEDQVRILESLGLSITEIQEYFDNENMVVNSS